MKFDSSQEIEGAKSAILLANINDRMIAIREMLGANPAVASATRGCDVRLYRESCVFEAYVEAETRIGVLVSWLLDVTLTSTGWSFERRVAKQTKDGEQVEIEFEDFASPDFSDLAANCLALMAPFEEAARSFDVTKFKGNSAQLP
jgi:hypothetical protein